MNDNHTDFRQEIADDDKRSVVGRPITWVGIGVNVVLTLTQVVVGYSAHSQSLMAEAKHP